MSRCAGVPGTGAQRTHARTHRVAARERPQRVVGVVEADGGELEREERAEDHEREEREELMGATGGGGRGGWIVRSFERTTQLLGVARSSL